MTDKIQLFKNFLQGALDMPDMTHFVVICCNEKNKINSIGDGNFFALFGMLDYQKRRMFAESLRKPPESNP